MWKDSVYAAILVYNNRTKNLVGTSEFYYAHEKVTPDWAEEMDEYVTIFLLILRTSVFSYGI